MKSISTIILSAIIVAASSVQADTTLVGVPAFEKCLLASNCEVYETDHGPAIRFVNGTGPGTTLYNSSFATGNSSTPAGENSFAVAGDHTEITLGDKSLNYGTVWPWEAVHHLFELCHNSACDTTPLEMHTLFASQSETYEGNLVLHAQGHYNGWSERDNFVNAIITSASNGVDSWRQKWSHGVGIGGGAVWGEQWQSRHTSFVAVSKFGPNNEMKGFMDVRIAYQNLSEGWCGRLNGFLGALAGAVNPLAGGFFGIVGAFCT
ncbi:hypothetical protein EJ08DRAFT_705673 [Tothia fuscella]|uniref:Uncharacterized protein n=1 Tax=Tothia fuscella TaxID=1048955 RepID=A0A9P4TTM9_9PEZI|nr:hypothetical protein EJ08DRAFT_705673 [Tothia fuscella]